MTDDSLGLYHLHTMDLSPIIDPGFWFDLTPVRMSPTFEAMLFVLFALLIIAGAVMRIYVRNRSLEKYVAQTILRFAKIASVGGVTGFVLLFFAFEEIQFFGSRFWMLVWLIGVAIAVGFVVKFMRETAPMLRAREQSRAEVNKYLPRRSR